MRLANSHALIISIMADLLTQETKTQDGLLSRKMTSKKLRFASVDASFAKMNRDVWQVTNLRVPVDRHKELPFAS